MKKEIMEKIKTMKNYSKLDRHYKEAYQLIELINYYNELIASILNFDWKSSKITILLLYINRTFIIKR